jgi:steroid delta-isomerase-like uncharacterized protein
MPDREALHMRQMREDVVRRHIEAENAGDVAGVVDTFHRPRYHIVPAGEIREGASAVRAMWEDMLKSFPDFRFEQRTLHHADAAVILEGRFTGTQRGDWAGLAPTGRRIDVPVACVFEFDGNRLMSETVYFDFATAQRQLSGT